MAKRRFVSLSSLVGELQPNITTDPGCLIEEGRVLVDGRFVLNPRARVSVTSSVVVTKPTSLRGQKKLAAALARLEVDVEGQVALDVGAAAGGFTLALLEAGARRVFAVDAGFGQLIGSLRQDERVTVLERTNIAQLDATTVDEAVAIITLDLSYLPVASAARQLAGVPLGVPAQLIALIKPMYELGLSELPPVERLSDAVELAANGVVAAGWEVLRVVQSPVRGRRGAVEFFLHGRAR